MDRRGIEPRFPGCKPGVFPFDEQPGLESPKSNVQSRKDKKTAAAVVSCFLTLDFGLWTFAIRRIDRGGSRTHKVTALSTPPLCRFAYSAVFTLSPSFNQ
jgi:hypothetical protein